ncbi:MAG: hypothetical protein NVS3B19_15610 [Ginsengibacter sp.]
MKLKIFAFFFFYHLVFLSNAQEVRKGAIIQNNDSLVVANLNNRTALIIGNSNYILNQLKNPTNDADTISAVLKNCGFRVTVKKDLSLKQLNRAINDYGDTLLKYPGVTLFYYSGHGIQYNAENYLLPIDANIQKPDDIEVEALRLNKVFQKMNVIKKGLNIIILDACRNNPFTSITDRKGLSDINTTPSNTLILYATSPNKVALDGKEKNSPFTKALKEKINGDTLDILQIAKKAGGEVAQETEEFQTPAFFGTLYNDFYFKQRKSITKPTLYILSIGIAQYFDQRYNLQFSVKDAKDFSELFKSSVSSLLYNGISSYLLMNRDATKENILKSIYAIKGRAKEGDVILVYLNGHIISSKLGESFFMPTDGDFNDPQVNGIPTKIIISLLSDILLNQFYFLLEQLV